MKRSRVDHPETRKAQILSAAEAVMGEKGFHGILLDDVARRAGISKGTLYLYFKDKEDLLDGLLTTISFEYEKSFSSVPGLGTMAPLEKLRRVVREGVAGMRNHRPFFAQLSMMSPEAYGKKACRSLKNCFKGHMMFLAGIIREGITAGVLRKTDPSLAAVMLMSLVKGVVSLDVDLLPMEDRVDAISGKIIELFLKGIGT